jgi:uncharacterized protein YndB with AHSA1/START domain
MIAVDCGIFWMLQEERMADILHMVTIKARPKKVYAALIAHVGVAGWWTENAHAESKGWVAKHGQRISFRYGEK